MDIRDELKRLEGQTLESIEYLDTPIDWSTVNQGESGDVRPKTSIEINGEIFQRTLRLVHELPGIKIRIDSMKAVVGRVSAQNALRMVFLWDLGGLS